MAGGEAEIALGPILLGTLLDVLLYGITVIQVYIYHTSSKRDSWFMQAFIYVLFLADTAHTVLAVVYVYNSLINHFGDFGFLLSVDLVFATDAALTSVLGGLVQGFFAWRVKVLTENIFLVSLIIICSSSGLLTGIATSVAMTIFPKFADFQRFKVVVIIWLGSASLADMLITVTLVTFLRSHKTGFASTDGHVDRMIRLTMQTGLLTSLVALVDLFTYLLDPSGVHLIFNLALSKLYINSLLSSLNARKGWRYDSDNIDAVTGPLSFDRSALAGTEVRCYNMQPVDTSYKTGRTTSSTASQSDIESQKKNPDFVI